MYQLPFACWCGINILALRMGNPTPMYAQTKNQLFVEPWKPTVNSKNTTQTILFSKDFKGLKSAQPIFDLRSTDNDTHA